MQKKKKEAPVNTVEIYIFSILEKSLWSYR